MSARWIAMMTLTIGLAVAPVDARAEDEPAARDGRCFIGNTDGHS